MPKIKQHPTDPTCFMYWDVATNEVNCFWVDGDKRWQWNEDYEKPTVTPSILNSQPWKVSESRNHVFIRDGKIQYLGDCTHAMAGQTVEMIEFPENW